MRREYIPLEMNVARFFLVIGLAQLYQLEASNSDFCGVPAQKRESNQRRLIATRL
jgi:hypothetical protein